MSDIHDYGDEEPINQWPASDFAERASSKKLYSVAVLTTHGASLAKTWVRDRKGLHCEDYDKAKTFDMRTHAFDNFAELCTFFDRLGGQYQYQKAIIYGDLHPRFEGRAHRVQRLLYRVDGDETGTIVEAEHAWLPIDFDDDTPLPEGIDPIMDPEGAIDYVISKLPLDFQGAAHRWQLTSKTGVRHPNGELVSPGIHARLFFPLRRAIANSEAGCWLAGVPGVDPAIYRPAQLIYTAAPSFVGLDDPVPRRTGFRAGRVVEVPEIPEPAKPRHERQAAKPSRERHAAEVPDDLEESDDDPRLLREGLLRKKNFHKSKGHGTGPLGNRVCQLIQWLGDMATEDGLIASAEMISEILGDDYETPIHEIERLLAKRQNPRGCDVIDEGVAAVWQFQVDDAAVDAILGENLDDLDDNNPVNRKRCNV